MMSAIQRVCAHLVRCFVVAICNYFAHLTDSRRMFIQKRLCRAPLRSLLGAAAVGLTQLGDVDSIRVGNRRAHRTVPNSNVISNLRVPIIWDEIRRAMLKNRFSGFLVRGVLQLVIIAGEDGRGCSLLFLVLLLLDMAGSISVVGRLISVADVVSLPLKPYLLGSLEV